LSGRKGRDETPDWGKHSIGTMELGVTGAGLNPLCPFLASDLDQGSSLTFLGKFPHLQNGDNNKYLSSIVVSMK